MSRLEVARPDAPAVPAVVRWIAAAGAASSGAALVAAILTDRPLWLASTFVFVPGLLATVAAVVWARGRQAELFLERVRRGVVAGVVGTAAYDVVRGAVELAGLATSNTFRAITIFGSGLTGRPPSHAASVAAGWAFHACNGVGFAIAYLLLAAGRPVLAGVAFGLALETAMVLLYPGWLGFTLTAEFLSVSILGHVAYGAVLGVAGRRSP